MRFISTQKYIKDSLGIKINSFAVAAMLASIITVGTLTVIPNAFATTWYPGEGLKQGDYYRYRLGDVNWHNGALVEMDFWVKNQTSNDLNLEMVVHDGSIIPERHSYDRTCHS